VKKTRRPFLCSSALAFPLALNTSVRLVLYYWAAAIQLQDKCISGEYLCTGQDPLLYVGKNLAERMNIVSEVSHAVIFLGGLSDER